MARGRKGGGGRQQPVKGFRPGREPPQLRKQQVKQQLGEGNWAQKQLVDVLAGRSPEEARRMMARWRNGVLALAIVLAVAAALLFAWSAVAGAVVAVLAAVLLAIWLRLRKQRASLEALADALSGRRR